MEENLSLLREIIFEKIKEREGQRFIYISKVTPYERCPWCGSLSSKIHQKDVIQKVKDRPILGKEIIWVIRKRRFRCINPNCSHKTFTEIIDGIERNQRRTEAFKEFIYNKYLKMTLSDTKKTLKEEYRVKIGLSTIYRDFVHIGEKRKGALFYQRRKETPKRIELDEFAKGKGHNYATLLMDLDKGKPVTATSGKTKAAIKDVLFNSGYDLSKIKVATMDMNDEARNVCKELLPQVKVVIDKFHLIRLVENIVNKQLLFLKEKADKISKRLASFIFKKRALILKGKEKVRKREESDLFNILSLSPELSKVYNLKEDLRDLYKRRKRYTATLYLLDWQRKAKESGIPEMEDLSDTIDNWFPEIINYFDSKDTRITNGKTERKIGSFKRFQYARYHYKLLDNLNYYILGRES